MFWMVGLTHRVGRKARFSCSFFGRKPAGHETNTNMLVAQQAVVICYRVLATHSPVSQRKAPLVSPRHGSWGQARRGSSLKQMNVKSWRVKCQYSISPWGSWSTFSSVRWVTGVGFSPYLLKMWERSPREFQYFPKMCCLAAGLWVRLVLVVAVALGWSSPHGCG